MVGGRPRDCLRSGLRVRMEVRVRVEVEVRVRLSVRGMGASGRSLRLGWWSRRGRRWMRVIGRMRRVACEVPDIRFDGVVLFVFGQDEGFGRGLVWCCLCFAKTTSLGA